MSFCTRKVFPAPEYTATFVENHDNPRWLHGCGDRDNREPLWDNYNTKSTLYQLLGKAHALRKKVQIWNYGIVQRYADVNFYALLLEEMY